MFDVVEGHLAELCLWYGLVCYFIREYYPYVGTDRPSNCRAV